MKSLLLFATLAVLALPLAAAGELPAPDVPPASLPPAVDAAPLAEVLSLIEQRLNLAPDVARHKWNSGGAIEDAARERAIIAGLGRQAGQLGLPVAWAESFFGAQIEASKSLQRTLFERWRQQQAGPFADAPDLASHTRPRLDALTPRLLQALARAWPLLSDPARCEEIAAQTARWRRAAGHDEQVTAMASRPLLAAGRP